MTTFDPNTLGASVTLSADLLTVTATTPAADTGATATTTKSALKIYLELNILVAGGAGSDTGWGVCQGTPNYVNLGNNSALGITHYLGPTGQIWFNGAFTGLSIASAVNNVMAAAYDFGNSLAWFKNLTTASNWNATVGADPSTGVSGINFAALTGPFSMYCLGGSGVTTSNRALFGPAGFTGPMPAGFLAWDAQVPYSPVRQMGPTLAMLRAPGLVKRESKIHQVRRPKLLLAA